MSTNSSSSRKRRADVVPPLTVVDLFSGAGGLSLGFQRAGWRTLESHDHFEAAVFYHLAFASSITNIYLGSGNNAGVEVIGGTVTALAKIATSAEEAKNLGYFRKTDGVTFDRARQVTDAKARVIGMAESGYHPPIPRAYRLPGESGIATLSMMVDTLVAGGYASEHDAKIARKVATVLCGGASGAAHDVTEDEMLELEADAFVSLCGEPKSQERMQYMLMNNKPLRN